MTLLKWWQIAVFYQIYPRSFADSNGDGIGDLAGIVQRLDYLKDLGIDAIWLSPHYPSPQFDCGYDIADYTGVDPEYGTLEDFKLFLDHAHQRGLRVILDLVLNHTSDQHPWFIESRSSRDNPKSDWYVWLDGVDGGPPNNWISTFGGSAWEYEPQRGQYYYHYFFKQQPDLNWRSQEVKQAMFDAVRFWLDMGVDGFRLDAIGTIYEHPDFPDHAGTQTLVELRESMEGATTDDEREQAVKRWEEVFRYQSEQPGMHELLKELRRLVDGYGDRVLVGETDQVDFLGEDDELHLVFNFPLMFAKKLTAAIVQENQAARLSALAEVSPTAWPCNTLGNHDSPRIYSRYGDGEHDAQLARLSLALMLTLRGTPFLYNGEEIGMTDLMLDDIDQFRDMLGVWLYEAKIDELGYSPEQSLEEAARFTRDKNRTPLQWQNAPNAGFCPPGVQPWLPVNPNYTQGINVADQEAQHGSMLSFYRTLLKVRRENPALIEGKYLYPGDPTGPGGHTHDSHETPGKMDFPLVFLRASAQQTCLVVLNFASHAHTLDLKRTLTLAPNVPEDTVNGTLRRIYSNARRPADQDNLRRFETEPFEIFIGALE